jgi:ferritin-like metal-binding protein YciE
MHSQALEDLFVRELEEIYDAEKQIYSGLGAMAKSAQNADLKSAFTSHRKETKGQIARIEKTFAMLGEKCRRGRAAGVSGLIRQSRDVSREKEFDPSVADAGLIAGAQKIEHYEMAAYGCLRTHAGLLGYKQIEDLLGKTAKEEEEADALLTRIAETEVNQQAAAAPYAQARTGPRHGTNSEPAHGRGIGLGTLALGLLVGGAFALMSRQPRPITR